MDLSLQKHDQRRAESLATLNSSIARSLSLLEKIKTARLEHVRMIHHFACTGGTIISKHIALQPNVQLLSEICPLSTLPRITKPRFAPSDMIGSLRHSVRPPSDTLILNMFMSSLTSLHRMLSRQGRRIIIREHSHSHFCTERKYRSPTLASVVAQRLPVISILTVRHPIESYLSLDYNEWLHFVPSDLGEYCIRYHAFLDSYKDKRIFKYEEFVERPKEITRNICDEFEMQYLDYCEQILSVARLSGDSGRSDDIVAARAPRKIPVELMEAASKSSPYKELCDRLRYTDIPPMEL